jgi:opacity protein-like surface antigen
MKMILAACAVLTMTGCASVLNDVTHPVRIETKTVSGETVANAECKLTNDYGVFDAKSGATIQVRRSSKDLDITCTHPQQPEAKGRAISRANGGMAGNILLGGGIGAIIDHNKGTAYTYPTWIQLVFGQTLIFDRREEKEGAPLAGKAPEAVAQTQPAR